MFPLDHRGPMTRLGHRPGEVLTRFPASKNENFISFNVLHFSISFTYLNIRVVLSIRMTFGRRKVGASSTACAAAGLLNSAAAPTAPISIEVLFKNKRRFIDLSPKWFYCLSARLRLWGSRPGPPHRPTETSLRQ